MSLVNPFIVNTSGVRVPVEVRRYHADTRYCPTTEDAVAIAACTHAVHRTCGDWIFRGTLAACERFVANRQSAEDTRRIIGDNGEFVDGVIAASEQHPDENDPYWEQFWTLKSASR